MRQGCDVFDNLDGQPGRLKRGDGRFASGAGPLDAHFNLFEAELGGSLSRLFGCALRGEGRALAATLESNSARGRERQRITRGVGDCDDCVVECRLNVGNAPADITSLFAFFLFRHCLLRISQWYLGKRPVPKLADNAGEFGVKRYWPSRSWSD